MKFLRFLRLRGRGLIPPAPFAARRRFYLIGLAILTVSFLASFYFFFPAEVLKTRVEQEIGAKTPLEMHLGELVLLFPPGLQGREIEVRTGVPEREPVQVTDLTLKPLWSTLFGGNPGLLFQAQLMGGEVSGSLRREGEIDARLASLTFSEPLAPGSSLQVDGRIEEGIFTGALPLKPTTETALDLILQEVRLSGMTALGSGNESLPLGTITLKGTGRGNAFRIERLTAEGGEIAVSGGGTLMLTDPPERSRLNLNLEMRPGAGFDPNLKGLLDLFAKAGRDGSYRLRLTGTLGNPVFAQ